MDPKRRAGVTAAAVALALSAGACSSSPSTGDGDNAAPSGDITVWDYYGSATPIKMAVDSFTEIHPDVTIDYQAYDYDTMQQKYAVAVSSGTAPDVATLDMTWIPTYAANQTLADLTSLSGGTVNGQSFESLYSPGALEAMTSGGHYVTALYDFDSYALYYRADLFDSLDLAVPKTWQDLNSVASALTTSAPGRRQFLIAPDTFHYAQFLFQAGGSILNADNTAAAFNTPAGVEALEEFVSLLKAGGIYWGPDQGDTSAGINDGRIAIFLDGPYMMGILKSAAPDQSGKWKVASAPVGRQAGSYLGGTGLSIPATSTNKSTAWAFVQYLLQTEQQLMVARIAGAAPATTPALQSQELRAPDPYFGGDAPLSDVFLDAQAHATHFPYVKQWSDIDQAITDAVEAALLGRKSPQAALADAEQEVNSLLG